MEESLMQTLFSNAYTNDEKNLENVMVTIRNLNHFYGEGALKKQILFDINLVKPQSLSYKTAMRKSQNTSIFQFTIEYDCSTL
jgi:hypothetical protein